MAAASTIDPALITRTLDEAAAIWRDAGITFDWHLMPMVAYPDPHARPLLVIVDDEVGRPRDGGLPIGWVVFDGDHDPEPQLHVSRRNARRLLQLMRQDPGGERMPRLEEEVLLGRAMGRALAHELGHYLFASKRHTPRGLMASQRSAAEMFGSTHGGYWIQDDQRLAAAARIRDLCAVTSRAIANDQAEFESRGAQAQGAGTSSGDGRNVYRCRPTISWTTTSGFSLRT
ncbi:MAG: hypothetical protein ACM3SQ_00055 [Betaproteobacteria bacterium]